MHDSLTNTTTPEPESVHAPCSVSHNHARRAHQRSGRYWPDNVSALSDARTSEVADGGVWPRAFDERPTRKLSCSRSPLRGPERRSRKLARRISPIRRIVASLNRKRDALPAFGGTTPKGERRSPVWIRKQRSRRDMPQRNDKFREPNRDPRRIILANS